MIPVTLKNLSACMLAVATLIVATTAMAQDEEHHGHPQLLEDPALTLADVVAAAVLNQPRWKEADARREQADAWGAVSRGLIAGQPVFNLDYFDDRVFDSIGEHEYQAGMTFPLWWPGQKNASSELAMAMQAETGSWETSLAWSVAGQVRSILASVDVAEARLASAIDAESDALQLLQLTEAMERAGEVPRADVMMARGRLLDARSVTVEADAEVVDAHRQYSVFTGLETIPAGGLDETMAPDGPVSLEHPLLAEYASSLDRARQQTEQKRLASRGNPTVTVGARNQRGDRLTDSNNTLALSFSIPLGGKRFTTAGVTDSRRQEVDIEVSLLDQQRSLQTRLHEIEHDMLVTAQKLDLASDNAELSAERWDMARSAYEQGEVTMTDVILALQQNRAAQLQLVTLQLHQKALVSAFNQTLGVMP